MTPPLARPALEQALYSHPEVIFPLATLLLAACLKFSVARPVTRITALESVFELPVDIMFLALSLLAGGIITQIIDAIDGFVTCVIFISITIIVCLLWRQSQNFLTQERIAVSATFCIIGYSFSIACIMWSIMSLT